jgi:hypothetical protein
MPYQGLFAPKHPEKYIGNASTIVYRSSWERRFFVYCDETPGVLRWASEEFYIPYLSPVDQRVHRYFPDVWMEVQTPTGKQAYLIEIKPKQQTELRQVKRKTAKFLREAMQVAINHAKWDAARAHCQERGWTFQVLTEDHLFGGAHGRS